MPPCSTVVHIISRQSLLFHISSFTFSNHLLLGLPLFRLPCTSISFLCSAPVSSSLAPYHFNLLSWTFFAISPTFAVPLILSFLILSSFVTLHGSILISANSNLFSCTFFNAHVFASYSTILNTFALIITRFDKHRPLLMSPFPFGATTHTVCVGKNNTL